MNRVTLPVACSRRQFLSGCAACVGCAAGATWLQPNAGQAAELCQRLKLELIEDA
jgi:hypothetical protein